ncbi:ABC transporter permease [Pasteurellaceae bacterium LIM206]|nr:ABC transporter permease [Pasteurellaceae bacterium LIM206]
MKYGDQTTLKRSFVIQGRVINALLLREIITRYGRNNIGFLWLFVEPLMMTLLITLMWKFLRADRYSTLNIVAFTITGYPLAMMWRNVSNRCIGSISANISLLYHRNVRVLDTIISRALLEVAGATIAQIVLMLLMFLLGWIDMPNDIFYMVIGWVLMAIFAFGLGMIICYIAYHVEFFGRLWGTLSFIMVPLSGAFFFVHSLPAAVQHYALMIPMIHGSEMFRHGYFGLTVTTYESPWFIVVTDLALILLGLLMIRKLSHGVEPS